MAVQEKGRRFLTPGISLCMGSHRSQAFATGSDALVIAFLKMSVARSPPLAKAFTKSPRSSSSLAWEPAASLTTSLSLRSESEVSA